jgi:hypothetical protein
MERSTHFEGRYRSLGDGAFQAGAVRGEHITLGPLWGYAMTTRVRLRLEVHPWLAIRTALTDVASSVQVHLPYGADSSLHVYLPIRLGAAAAFPGVRVTGHGARSTQASEPPVTGWDWGAGWGVTLAVALGSRSPLTLDAATPDREP